MKDFEISRELASSVLGLNVVYTESCEHRDGIIGIWTDMNTKPAEEINIYEFVHLNLKQWANFKNVFNIIDWSGEPEEIIAKAEEIMNEIN